MTSADRKKSTARERFFSAVFVMTTVSDGSRLIHNDRGNALFVRRYSPASRLASRCRAFMAAVASRAVPSSSSRRAAYASQPSTGSLTSHRSPSVVDASESTSTFSSSNPLVTIVYASMLTSNGMLQASEHALEPSSVASICRARDIESTTISKQYRKRGTVSFVNLGVNSEFRVRSLSSDRQTN